MEAWKISAYRSILTSCAATVNGGNFVGMGMGTRRLATLFILFALVAKLVFPCEASAATAVGAFGAPIAKCHLFTDMSSAQGESKPAPLRDLDHDSCSCALCEADWSILPPAVNIFEISGLAYRIASPAPPMQAFAASWRNRGARPRGPPSFV